MNENKNGVIFKSDVLALINCHIKAYIPDNNKHESLIALCRLFDAVNAMPVYEAEWIYDHWCEFKCSNCGNWSNSKPYKGREKYCPECGAKMKI